MIIVVLIYIVRYSCWHQSDMMMLIIWCYCISVLDERYSHALLCIHLRPLIVYWRIIHWCINATLLHW